MPYSPQDVCVFVSSANVLLSIVPRKNGKNPRWCLAIQHGTNKTTLLVQRAPQQCSQK